jgi:phage major head subunit gpT-like protein
MSDLKETIQLATYGKLFGITRQALANDDLNALGAVPRAMGMAANRKVGDVVYAVLTTGTTATMLQDSTALFEASSHKNYVTAGGAPSVSTLDAMRTAMATQTDPQGKTIGLRARHLIVPIALQTTAETLVAATYDPAGTAGTLKPNPFQNAYTVTADHRLDAFNPAGWFAAAGTNQVVVGFLNGQQTPYMESKDGWSIDGIEYKVRIDCAATAEDFRGLYYNDGA